MRSSHLSNTGTAPSSTSSARFGLELLAARDRRQELLTESLRGNQAVTVFLSLNLPGPDKSPPGTDGLFRWALKTLRKKLPALTEIHAGYDLLGPFACFSGEYDPFAAKRVGIDLETSRPAARLLDVDVYDREGSPLDRQRLDSPQRSCLLCHCPARECIRLQRHPFAALKRAAHDLLRPFRP